MRIKVLSTEEERKTSFLDLIYFFFQGKRQGLLSLSLFPHLIYFYYFFKANGKFYPLCLFPHLIYLAFSSQTERFTFMLFYFFFSQKA